jgi:YfiH family protein
LRSSDAGPGLPNRTYNAVVGEWVEEVRQGVAAFRPDPAPPGLLVAFSGRGTAPEGEPFPTSFLSRRFARALGLDGVPIVRATQVHGSTVSIVRRESSGETVRDAGECDGLATGLAGTALVVQTADCVPILIAADGAIAAVHAGWRGSARNVAGSAIAALRELGSDPGSATAWIGPAIGVCCYQVGGEVSARFAGDFVRSPCGGRRFLDLKALNRAQLVAAGVAAERISIHPACTLCGGDRFAS